MPGQSPATVQSLKVRFDQNVGQRLILVSGESEQTAVNMGKLAVRELSEQLTEHPPGLAALHDAIFCVFLLGIFGSRLNDELAEPPLDDKGGEIKIIPLLFAESDGIVD